MRIAPHLLEQIVDHARREHPNECCGFVAQRDDEAVAVHPATNVAASPLRFEVDGPEVARLMYAIDDAGESIGAIYHSHTRSAPFPSQTDINFSQGWPGVEWLIVGLADGSPEVRSYLIDGGVVTEVAVDVG